MADNIEGGNPPPVVTPSAAASAPASSSTVQDINSAIKSASTPAALAKLAAQIRDNPQVQLKSAPAKKAEPAPAPVAAPASEETPAEVATETASEETPAQETEQAAATETPAETETEETEGDGPVTPVSGKRAHLRIPENDQVGRLAAALMKRNRDMSMVEAVAKASEQLVVTPKGAEQAPKDDGKPKMPQTVQEVETLREQKFAEYEKALAEVRLEDAGKLNREIIALTEHRSSLERNADRQAVEQEAKFNRDFNTSATKATELYPFAADPKSQGGKRMLEIEAELKDNDDPLYYSADKPLKLAQMVAAELSIAPRAKKPAPAAAAAPVAQAPKKGVVPTGGSRTTPPPPNQKPEIQQKIEGIKSLNDLRQFSRSLGMRHI